MKRGGRPLAFTIIELLVVIAIATFIVAIFIPALTEFRKHSRHTKNLALQRQLIAGLGLYTEAHAEALPYMGTPGNPEGPILVHGHNVKFQGYFSDQRVHWMSLIVPTFAAVDPADLDHRGLADDRGIIRSLIHLTECAFADPRLFQNRSDVEVPMAYFRATRTGDIFHPSRKGLTLDVSLGEPGEKPGGWLAAFADGSAREVPRGTPSEVVNQPWSNSASPVLNTIRGLAGVDFER